ncbi:hypothetical protein HMPREF0496_1089 [Lentilactobacillus hilgardii ATCC 27305]|nr:hypothetical protein HMPREF0496_1089 [Lentilactobacillus hilgardii ATCC 27305]
MLSNNDKQGATLIALPPYIHTKNYGVSTVLDNTREVNGSYRSI